MKTDAYYNKLSDAIKKTPIKSIDTAIEKIRNAIEQEKWVFTCGNGGSASTASHYVTDWGKMRLVNKGLKFKSLCLSDNIGMLTAYGNDISYGNVFDYSLANYASEGDVLVVVSGSGNSENVVNAVKKAKELGLITICVVGYDGGILARICDHVIHFEVNDMQICEDLHLSFGHVVMKALCD